MNERIRQIAQQAGLQPFEDCGPKYVYKMEKFAELLVRECAKISKETCNELKADETIQMPAFKTSVNLYHATLRNKLDEHFGVEL